MTHSLGLERSYRRWLRWYPRSFRREHEAEILAVLMAGAREGQRRPELTECVDLISSAVRMHLRPRVARSNRSLLNAVKLMYVGATVELATAIVILATTADVKSNVTWNNPGFTDSEWHAIFASQIAPNEVAAFLAVGFWLWMAWSIGRGHQWARIVFALFVALNLVGLFNGVVNGSALYARPDLAIAIVLCLIELVAVAAIFRARIAPDRSAVSRTIAES